MLERIKQNITSLIALYEGEKERADSLAERLAACETQIEAYRKQITDLNRKIDNSKLAAAFVSEGQGSEAKERLGKLINEVDKCIRLLEK